jgi:DNA-binding transcriptional MerR regulator
MAKKEDKKYFISEVCEKAHVHRYNLLWWEKKGWIKPEKVLNPLSNQRDRHYSEEDIVRAKMLKAIKSEEGIDFVSKVLTEAVSKNDKYRKELNEIAEKNII